MKFVSKPSPTRVRDAVANMQCPKCGGGVSIYWNRERQRLDVMCNPCGQQTYTPEYIPIEDLPNKFSEDREI